MDLNNNSCINRKEIPRTAIVILNKDNERGLEKTLTSLSRQTLPPCEYFDIFIVDGGSRDGSREVATRFSREIKCIYFIEQRIKGGTGPARREIIEILRNKNYQLVVWGDSENEYYPDYVENILRKYLVERSRDPESIMIISGRSIVRRDSIWSRLFYWYHGYHQIFPVGVGDRHAPGNNKAEEISIYDLYTYPPCIRSEDFIFSYYLYKNFRDKVRYFYEEKARVLVSIPRSFREILSWQRNRVRGLVQCSRYIGLRYPPDLIYWTIFLLINILLISATLFLKSLVSSITLVVMIVSTWIFLYIRGRSALERIDLASGFLGYIGLLLHAFFTLYYSIYFLAKEKSRSD